MHYVYATLLYYHATVIGYFFNMRILNIDVMGGHTLYTVLLRQYSPTPFCSNEMMIARIKYNV